MQALRILEAGHTSITWYRNCRQPVPMKLSLHTLVTMSLKQLTARSGQALKIY